MRACLAALRRAPPARLTNLTLLAALLVAFGTGAAAVATGSPRGRWVVVLHGIAALAVVVLGPWKARVVRGGLRRARASRWFSLARTRSARSIRRRCPRRSGWTTRYRRWIRTGGDWWSSTRPAGASGH